ncbi:MAG: DUF4251 domain-containing protein [Chitinophagaceae bacterium]
MKSNTFLHFKWFFLLAVLFVALQPAQAQNSRKEKEKEVEAMVKNGEFIFMAQTASPMRGRTVQLTSEYDVVISKDSIRTFLPYFGRAYMAQPYGTGEGGIKLTTTEFNYNLSDKKKKRWNLLIEPKDRTEVQQLVFSISKNGYATLQVVSTNRDPITFNGYVTSRQ